MNETNINKQIVMNQEITNAVLIRISKIIGQLKTVANMIENANDGLVILTQYSAATAAVSSLMRFIAKDTLSSSLGRAAFESEIEQYINHVMYIVADFDDFDEDDDCYDNGIILL